MKLRYLAPAVFLLVAFSCGKGLLAPTGVVSTSLGISPQAGSRGTLVTVQGEGFVSGVGVVIGDTTCAQVTILSSTELTCVIGPGRVGVADVVVSWPDGRTERLTGGYTYKSFLFAVHGTGVSSLSIAEDGSLTVVDVETVSLFAAGSLQIDLSGRFLAYLDSTPRIASWVIDSVTGALGTIKMEPVGVSGAFAFSAGGDLVFQIDPNPGGPNVLLYSVAADADLSPLGSDGDSILMAGLVASPDGRNFYAGIVGATAAILGYDLAGSDLITPSESYGSGLNVAGRYLAMPPTGDYVILLDSTTNGLVCLTRAANGSLAAGTPANSGSADGLLRLHPRLRLGYRTHPGIGEASLHYWDQGCAWSSDGADVFAAGGIVDLQVSRDGRFAYGANQNLGRIQTFELNDEGKVTVGGTNALAGVSALAIH